MDPTIVDLMTQFGALGVLLYLLPLLSSIKTSLAALADAKRDVIAGLEAAGVRPETPTVRDTVTATVRHLKGAAALLLACALLLAAGCSCNGDVAEGLHDLEQDFNTYRRASIARVASQADLHAQLGDAIAAHVAEARRRAAQ